ncbi:hypothetical protein P4H27_00210 [Paenibacillus taichungensis]|uniref:hypothetical protein n=1 Tax=Paenibacillus taichungensis TaxID=484184 RepID=UPI002DB9AC0A|nr:hypothetical protein [Paenibacillus taichungensis]MEC0105354.1 hypothetical protein [Paenibacillus taichungensis]MEC0200429.1 hypothetical protein [Paenibacillus taichungensis]
MRQKLFEYYKENASTHALIFRHMQWFRRLFLIVLFFNVILICVAAVGSFLTDFISSMLIWLLTSMSFFIFYRLNRLFDIKAMKILKKYHSISSSPQTWSEHLADIRITKVTEYLLEHDMHQKWKIERLIIDFQKDNERGKIPPLIAPSIILAISIPNLTQLCFQIYTYFNLEGNLPYFILNMSYPKVVLNILIFLVILVVSLFIVGIFSVLNKMYGFIQHQIVDNHAPKRSGLTETLENILYRLHDKNSG